MHKFSILIGCLVLVHSINADNVYAQRELTVRIEPGAIECFYERSQKNQVIDFEYQVIDGGHGDLDISFELQNPNGHPMVTEYKKSDNIHRFDVLVDGDYRYCFDNSFSSFNTKTVFFELIIEWDGEQGGAGKEDEWGKDILDSAVPDKLLRDRVCINFFSLSSILIELSHRTFNSISNIRSKKFKKHSSNCTIT